MLTAFAIGLAAGVAATPHCLGMCGGFPLYLAGSGKGGSLWRQVLFVAGKLFTYGFLGAVAASCGTILFRNTHLAPLALALRFALGALIAVFGLSMLGARLPRLHVLDNAADAGLVRGVFGGLLANPRPLSAFVLGLGVGFLPCPLPMGMLAAAVASRSTLHGIAMMAGVGVGTAPGLLAVGLFGTGLDRRFARAGMRVAGIIVLAMGLLTLGRATSAVLAHHPGSPPPCCCQERAR